MVLKNAVKPRENHGIPSNVGFGAAAPETRDKESKIAFVTELRPAAAGWLRYPYIMDCLFKSNKKAIVLRSSIKRGR